MKKSKLKNLNNIYLIFLLIILIIFILISFKTGMKLYDLVNMNNKETPVNSNIANWNFEVTIEY